MQEAHVIDRAAEAFEVERHRAGIPALHQEVNGRPLVYLDNAASSQRPQVVIDRIAHYYAHEHSNVHRGVHTLSQSATDAYEQAREGIRSFIGAASTHEIIFTRGTTESINLVAATYGRTQVQAGDEIVISTMEHHSNIVPWQLLCEEKGATLRVIPIDEKGQIEYDAFLSLLNDRTRLLAICHVSNSLGTVNPVERMIQDAHARGITVVLDGAQAMPHQAVDVQALDVDFYAFSGHKMFGPTGIGILYGKEALLEAMPPYQGGGDMIDDVSFERTTYNSLPHKFEAGTPNIAGVIGMGATVEYLSKIGMAQIARYEAELLEYATDLLMQIDGFRLIGAAEHKASVISFLLEGVHPYDAGSILDRLGIAVRTGHHCTQPLMDHWQIPGTVRASMAFYNTRTDIDALAEGILRVQKFFT